MSSKGRVHKKNPNYPHFVDKGGGSQNVVKRGGGGGGRTMLIGLFC